MKNRLLPLILIALIFLSLHSFGKQAQNVLDQIYKYEKNIKVNLESELKAKGVSYPPKEVYIRIFKYEEELEVWVNQPESTQLKLFKIYQAYNLPYVNIVTPNQTIMSKLLNEDNPQVIPREEIGPKDKIGDSKVPEGFYRLLYHNPWSSFHLSLALNYPNPADAIRGYKSQTITKKGKDEILDWWEDNFKQIKDEGISGAPAIWYNKEAKPLGNQIFIHGSYVTIGCIPIGDDKIEEVFVLTNPDYVGGTRVDIFPCRFNQTNLEHLKVIGKTYPELYDFWMNLKEGYDQFEKEKRVPRVWVNKRSGLHIYKLTNPADLIEL